MRLTILGSCASYAGPGHACSGYLVAADGARVLLDCGSGVLANLGRVTDPLGIDAVFVSHYHPDHFVDLYAYQALLRYAPSGPAAPMPLYLPAGLLDRMKCLLSDRGSGELDEAFVVTEIVANEPIVVGDLTVTPLPVEHTEPTFGLRAEADGAILGYSADSAPGAHLSAVLSGADLALCEATLPERYAGAAPHLTASQAGAAASAAGVGRLVLTHIWPTYDRAEALSIAAEAFGGPTSVANEFDVYEITSRKERS